MDKDKAVDRLDGVVLLVAGEFVLFRLKDDVYHPAFNLKRKNRSIWMIEESVEEIDGLSLEVQDGEKPIQENHVVRRKVWGLCVTQICLVQDVLQLIKAIVLGVGRFWDCDDDGNSFFSRFDENPKQIGDETGSIHGHEIRDIRMKIVDIKGALVGRSRDGRRRVLCGDIRR